MIRCRIFQAIYTKTGDLLSKICLHEVHSRDPLFDTPLHGISVPAVCMLQDDPAFGKKCAGKGLVEYAAKCPERALFS